MLVRKLERTFYHANTSRTDRETVLVHKTLDNVYSYVYKRNGMIERVEYDMTADEMSTFINNLITHGFIESEVK